MTPFHDMPTMVMNQILSASMIAFFVAWVAFSVTHAFTVPRRRRKR